MLQPLVEQELALDTAQIRKAATVYRAINHSLRMQMLRLLHKNSQMTVTQLYTKLNIEQSVASQHLAILRQAGIVATRRDGKNVFYSVYHTRVSQLHSIAEKMMGANRVSL
jgi:DNA-binding transcriptional ArsR family regulator